MTPEKLERANELEGQIRECKNFLIMFNSNDLCPEDGLFIKVPTCYYDMGMRNERYDNLNGDLAVEVFREIKKIVQTHLENCQKEFASL